MRLFSFAAVLVALGAPACLGRLQSVASEPAPGPGSPAPAAEGSGAPPAGAAGARAGDRCASGGRSTMLLARVGIGPASGSPATFVDLEVEGPEHDARRACEALVARELAITYPAESGLSARVVRACSDDALAEPKAGSAWLLAEKRNVDPVELMMASDAACRGERSSGVRASERRLSGYPDRESCEATLAKLREARARAAADAAATARSWLEGALGKERHARDEVCKGAGSSSPECARQKEIVRLLELRAGETIATADASGGGPICRAR